MFGIEFGKTGCGFGIRTSKKVKGEVSEKVNSGVKVNANVSKAHYQAWSANDPTESSHELMQLLGLQPTPEAAAELRGGANDGFHGVSHGDGSKPSHKPHQGNPNTQPKYKTKSTQTTLTKTYPKTETEVAVERRKRRKTEESLATKLPNGGTDQRKEGWA
ncbi:hypothetical protein GQ457_05G014220 [Hibiscus cannabinus]